MSDKVVKVRAYLTDETFGYDHWRATQFSAPSTAKPAVLLICESEDEQAALLEAEVLLTALTSIRREK